jgi:translation elongation factor EF-Tu-like GTPase
MSLPGESRLIKCSRDSLCGLFGGGDEPTGEIFGMKVEDVFTISGVGVVATGKIAVGVVRVGARLRKQPDSAAAGEDVGLILSGVGKDDVASGDMLQNIEETRT